MTRRVADRQRLRFFIDHRREAAPSHDLSNLSQPLIANLQLTAGNPLQVNVGTAPKTIFLGVDGAVNQALGQAGGWPVEPGNHQHAVGGGDLFGI